MDADVDPSLRAAVGAALDGTPGVVRVAFQPIVDLVRGVVAGYEALARFCAAPDDPLALLDAAHALGAGARLEAIVLRTALDARSALPPNTFLTVNVSPSALDTDPVRAAFAAAGDLRGVVVEVTEHEPVADELALREALLPLRAAGALIAIDDAGAGFASLQRLVALEPDVVKVDRALVAGVDRDPARAAAVEALGALAGRLDAWLLAEGVETAGELEALLTLGVPLGQGYFLGRPAPAMDNVAPEAAVVCRQRRDRARAGVLAALASPVHTLPATATGPAVARAFLDDPARRWIVLVDEHGRPVRLAPRDGGPAEARCLPVLCVTVGDELTDVVRRLLVRPPRERFSPVVLCDGRGAARALLTVERLLERLATVAELRVPPVATLRRSA